MYPLISTLWVLYKPLKGDLQHWLMWWFLYEITSFIKQTIFWWFPFVDYIHSMVLFIMYIPLTTTQLRIWIIGGFSKRKINKLMKEYGVPELYNEAKVYLLSRITSRAA